MVLTNGFENKGLHDGMAELLRDSVPKDENAGMGRVAAAPNPGIYLEAMEEAKNQTPKSDKTEGSRVFRQNGGI